MHHTCGICRPCARSVLLQLHPSQLNSLTAAHPPIRTRTIQHPHTTQIISDRAAQSGGYSMVDSAPTYVTPTTHSDTLVGAGGALTVLDAVVAEGRRREAAAGGKGAKAPAGFALIRPPGHHAVRSLRCVCLEWGFSL